MANPLSRADIFISRNIIDKKQSLCYYSSQYSKK